MAQSGITTAWLRAPHRGHDKWLSDGGARGSGRLIARKRRNGVFFSFRYSPRTGEEDAVAIGEFSESGNSGLTLAQARAAAGELAKLYRSGIRDLRAHRDHERAAAERERLEAEAARRAAAERGTLGQLLTAYAEHLKAAGKPSWRDTQNIVKNHVSAALAGRPAVEVSAEELVEAIGRVVSKGAGRTAGKLRSILRRAYHLAAASKLDPTAPAALRGFGISTNPLASIPALAQFNRVRDRHLSAPELGAFLRRVEKLPDGAQKDALRMLLLLGGQRVAQLLRIERGAVELDAGTVLLLDSKGKRSQPRRHLLPLVKEAQGILTRRLAALGEGEPVFSTDGTHPMRPETLSGVVKELVGEMLAAEPPEAREAFQLRDLRRTAETMLASLKVNSDVRAQIQSHGLSGVQQRHYNMHDYLLEKRQTLEKWARHLDKLRKGEIAKVTDFGSRRKKN
jgi:integrase